MNKTVAIPSATEGTPRVPQSDLWRARKGLIKAFWNLFEHQEMLKSARETVKTHAERIGLGKEDIKTLVNLWKRRRIAQYQKLIAEKPHDYETLKAIFEKIREIEEYDPIFDNQRAKDEEALLLRAISFEEITKEWSGFARSLFLPAQ